MTLREPQHVSDPDDCRTTRTTQRDVLTGTCHSDSSVRREYPRNDDALAPAVLLLHSHVSQAGVGVC
jgi:hypothetical protein